jgi:cell division topological specificity factor
MSMGLLRLLRGNKASAPVARERLQILLAHERGLRGQPDLLGVLREEILAVVSRHVTLDPTKVIVRLERGDEVSTLEVDIEVPNDFERKRAAVGLGPGRRLRFGVGEKAVRRGIGGLPCHMWASGTRRTTQSLSENPRDASGAPRLGQTGERP